MRNYENDYTDCYSLHERYPRAVIVGHHDLNPHKDCPCIINVAHEYADLQPM
jgi:hypothetical protein